MRERFINSTTLAGYGSLLLTVLPYFEAGKAMSATTVVLAVIGATLVLVGVLKTPPKNRLRRTEVNTLYEARSQYLPQLSALFGEYIKAVEKLSERAVFNDITTYTKYNYRLDFPVSLVFNNVIFLEAQEKELADLRLRIKCQSASVRDKRVIRFARGLNSACNLAYSYAIYTRLCRAEYGDKSPLTVRLWYSLCERMAGRLPKHYNKIKLLVDDLLEVTDDEQ